MIAEAALKILACPDCKGSLRLDDSGHKLICQTCMVGYELHNNIPLLRAECGVALPQTTVGYDALRN